MKKIGTNTINRGIIAIGLQFLLLSCGETRSKHWSTTEEINPKPAGGWLIVDPPPTARDITLIYNIESNEIWESFRLDELNAMNLPHECVEVESSSVRFPRQPKKHIFFPVSGWPENLTQASKNTADGTRIFRCLQEPPYPAWKGPNYYHLAIDKNTSRVYAWDSDGG